MRLKLYFYSRPQGKIEMDYRSMNSIQDLNLLETVFTNIRRKCETEVIVNAICNMLCPIQRGDSPQRKVSAGVYCTKHNFLLDSTLSNCPECQQQRNSE